ncbi:MAG TPA: phage portal protein, partial [Candidatus Limnocylindrales bacterium]
VGHVPVIRFLSKSDLDEEITSEVDDLITIQDQINLTTFGLLVVQHYGAFPQKWIAGWMAATTDEKVQVAANKVLTFEDADTKLGEFAAADLSGYIESRRDSLRNLAAISQTPAHALRGELVNLSAEALAAAEQAEQRKVTERETMFGEAWEQTLALAADVAGLETDPAAQVRWKDTEARAFAATVDALGKMATMLSIPVQELWERVPGVTQADVERWKSAAAQGDSFAQLSAMLDRQAGGVAPVAAAAPAVTA